MTVKVPRKEAAVNAERNALNTEPVARTSEFVSRYVRTAERVRRVLAAPARTTGDFSAALPVRPFPADFADRTMQAVDAGLPAPAQQPPGPERRPGVITHTVDGTLGPARPDTRWAA